MNRLHTPEYPGNCRLTTFRIPHLPYDALLVVGFGVSGTEQRSLSSQASSWRGLVGGAHPLVNVRQRVLVVLRSPSMAQRVAQNGGLASQQKERTWTRSALAAQRQLLSELSRQVGVVLIVVMLLLPTGAGGLVRRVFGPLTSRLYTRS
jgi:hypothetical protein